MFFDVFKTLRDKPPFCYFPEFNPNRKPRKVTYYDFYAFRAKPPSRQVRRWAERRIGKMPVDVKLKDGTYMRVM
jgi:hypothetical protein